MINFLDNNETPPFSFLHKASLACSRAIYLYLELWKDRDENNSVTIHLDDVRDAYYITPTKFVNFLMELCREGLASYRLDSQSCHVIHLVDADKPRNDDD